MNIGDENTKVEKDWTPTPCIAYKTNEKGENVLMQMFNVPGEGFFGKSYNIWVPIQNIEHIKSLIKND